MRFKPPLSESSSLSCASYHSSALQSPRHVAVRRLYPIALRSHPLLHLLRNKHGPMLPTRTPKRHRQIALTLLDVMRQKKLQHVRCLIEKLRRLRKFTDILRHLGMPSRQLAKLRHEMRIRQKSHIEHQVRLRRHSIFEPKTIRRNHQPATALLALKLRVDVRP